MRMKEKKSHGVQLLIRAVVKDPDGKVLSDTGQKPSKSFVIQFLEFLYALFNAPAFLNATDVNNVENKIYDDGQYASHHLKAGAPINASTWGIVVGTGDTAETNADYKLETQLTEGVTAGKITHGAVTVETTAVVGANVDLETKRSFPNNTGSTITIKEAGIYTEMHLAAYKYHCIIRDVLGTPIDVPDMCALTVYYTFRTTV